MRAAAKTGAVVVAAAATLRVSTLEVVVAPVALEGQVRLRAPALRTVAVVVVVVGLAVTDLRLARAVLEVQVVAAPEGRQPPPQRTASWQMALRAQMVSVVVVVVVDTATPTSLLRMAKAPEVAVAQESLLCAMRCRRCRLPIL